MASNQTANYGLNQWEAEDKVLRTEFNEDNAKIDAALAGIKAEAFQVCVGTYVGTGTYGQTAPNSLTFPFEPKMVLILPNSNGEVEILGAAMLRGQTYCSGLVTAHPMRLILTWEGNSLSWYSTAGYALYQLNTDGSTYYYLAIG